ncbi:unnamed protein product [Vitrella brassicaformis CCMP3155]|uniref:BTB domain-containing protein n=2 Tax=Vitrella brassicaformis TaxID=1169539 RepID=A0A0G4FGL9_VITBC|nr:unnamed protein product [Vitrella brassicaformis CCMP3155]|mmetsp:Transcript_21497/g.52652  ORF Transcript_21497/g.52652 Transcript_21497/m.52652 type:complete len:794 (+) Transcript_21497:100-2481(+)|eukprot:CEM12535.1 unnamed protein product [Vitrella brassicaformis CCMP3155]
MASSSSADDGGTLSNFQDASASQSAAAGQVVSCGNGSAPPLPKMKWSTTKVTEQMASVKNHTATLDGKRLYIFGGYDGKRNHSDLWALDLDTYEWTKPVIFGEVPDGRNGHTATLVGRCLYILGGWLGSGPLAANDLHILDLAQKRWVDPIVNGDPPGPCNMHTADLVQIDNRQKILVFRGGDGRAYLNDLHALDIEAMEWHPVKSFGEIPPPRANHSSATAGHRLFVFGGWDGHKRLNDLYVLDTETLVWTRPEVKGSIPHARAGMSLNYIRGYLYLFGGSGHATKCFNDLHCYDPDNQTWFQPPMDEDMPRPDKRAGHVAAVVDRKVFVLGGSFGPTYFRDCHILDTDPAPDVSRSETSSSLEKLRTSLMEFRNNPTFSDITFIVEGRQYYAHRIILCLLSDRFRAMFTSGMKESSEKEIEIPGVRYEVFESMMDFLYSGEVKFRYRPSVMPPRPFALSSIYNPLPLSLSSLSINNSQPFAYRMGASSGPSPAAAAAAGGGSGGAGAGAGAAGGLMGDPNDIPFLVELLQVSDEFMLEPVKEMCEQELYQRITQQNVLAVKQVAEQYQAAQLKRYCDWFLRQQKDTQAAVTEEEPSPCPSGPAPSSPAPPAPQATETPNTTTQPSPLFHAYEENRVGSSSSQGGEESSVAQGEPVADGAAVNPQQQGGAAGGGSGLQLSHPPPQEAEVEGAPATPNGNDCDNAASPSPMYPQQQQQQQPPPASSTSALPPAVMRSESNSEGDARLSGSQFSGRGLLPESCPLAVSRPSDSQSATASRLDVSDEKCGTQKRR